MTWTEADSEALDYEIILSRVRLFDRCLEERLRESSAESRARLIADHEAGVPVQPSRRHSAATTNRNRIVETYYERRNELLRTDYRRPGRCCDFCGARFDRLGKKRFCNAECKRLGYARQQAGENGDRFRPRSCGRCGVEYRPAVRSGPVSKFCSRKCREKDQSNRATKRQRRAAGSGPAQLPAR